MKKSLLLLILIFISFVQAEAQISGAVYRYSSSNAAAIGSDPDRKVFGEARISSSLEATLGYNFVHRSEVNFYSGFHLGTDFRNDDHFYLGVPFGLLVKPFSITNNFGFILEASPILRTNSGEAHIRVGMGMKYTFR